MGAVLLYLISYIPEFDHSVSAGSWVLVFSAIGVYIGSILAEKKIKLTTLVLYLLGAACVWGLLNGFFHALYT